MRMYLVSTLLVALFSTVFESSLDRAFTAAKMNDWPGAASALDEAFTQDPQTFDANNLHYLRGRIAENQNEWLRAREEFNKIPADNPLHSLAVWHALRASVQIHDEASAAQLLGALPREFPAELKMRIAREAGQPLAVKIYEDLSTREARLEQAKLQNDIRSMRDLLRENKDDDVALEAARLFAPRVLTSLDEIDVAQVFAAHRQFEQALLLYEKAAADPAHAADARYETGRVYFQLQDYRSAIDVYRAIAKDFEGTDWQKDAEYQIALSYWRMAEDHRRALPELQHGGTAAAVAIWRKLALDEFSYYGQRAAEKLGRTQSGLAVTSTAACLPADGLTVAVEADLANVRHPVRSELSRSSDVVSELVFLRLWDEAALWMERPGGARIPPRSAAEIAYLAGRYNRSIFYADRLPKTESTLPLLYPAGYGQTICNAAMAQNVDPVWLHAIIWQESKYNPNARSGAAARGLMQFIPETAQAIAASAGMPEVTPDKLYDPAISIQLGAKYWSTLLGQLNSPEMALAAYNGGPDNVEKWRSKALDPELFVADIGFTETKKYVLAVFAVRAAYASLLK